MKITALILFIMLYALVCSAVEFDLGSHGVLSVDVPDLWTVNGSPANRPDGTPVGYAFAFKPRGDANAKCLLTLAYVKKAKLDKEHLRQEVLRASEQFVVQSVEKKANLKEFSLARGYSAYCVLTDPSLVGQKTKKDEYKSWGSGQVQLNEDVLGVVSIFADDANGEEFKTMLAIINSLGIKLKGAN